MDIQENLEPFLWLQTRKCFWDNEYFYIGVNLEEPNTFGTLTESTPIIFHDNCPPVEWRYRIIVIHIRKYKTH